MDWDEARGRRGLCTAGTRDGEGGGHAGTGGTRRWGWVGHGDTEGRGTVIPWDGTMGMWGWLGHTWGQLCPGG